MTTQYFDCMIDIECAGLPSDIDYDFYIREANSILADIGASAEKRMQLMYGEAAELF